MNIYKNKNKGFTVIELIVVIAIIAVLSAIVLFNVNVYIAKSRDAKRVADIASIQKALEMYYSDKGYYPSSYGGTLFAASTGFGNWDGLQTALSPYISKLPIDPTNSPGMSLYHAGAYAYMYTAVLAETGRGVVTAPTGGFQCYALSYRLINTVTLSSNASDCNGDLLKNTLSLSLPGVITTGNCHCQ